MKPTKEFRDWYLSKKWKIPLIDLPFEMYEGIYRAYFREKGIYILNRLKITNLKHHLYAYDFDKKEILEFGGIELPEYKEAFEALVNKLFGL